MTDRRITSGRVCSRASQLEERIREIESELDNVHDNMRLLRRVVDKPDRNDLYPQYRARAANAAEPSAPVPASALRKELAPPPAGQRPLVAVRASSDNTRRVAAAVTRAKEAGIPPLAAGLAQSELVVRNARNHERFANYFISGSLQALQPLRRERRTQRDRAIVALAFLAVVLFWVIRLIVKVWQ